MWNKVHDEIQKQKMVDNCQLERIIAGLMFWSDSTQLAQFGHSNAWPIYLFFGNLSKCICAFVVSGTCHPIAFIPPVSSLPCPPFKQMQLTKQHSYHHCSLILLSSKKAILMF